uniref:Ionotropic glutamate receptor C-terminal domain-containing protein n=1 Tax=Anopheles dirus TaxID=7168 RepID=A0A182NE76_9DIPT
MAIANRHFPVKSPLGRRDTGKSLIVSCMQYNILPPLRGMTDELCVGCRIAMGSTVTVCFMCVVVALSSGDKTDSYPLLTPPDTDIAFILRAFVELQNQWCPPWRYKKIFILNYNTDPLSVDIITAILKINEPPKILTNEWTGFHYWTFENRRCAVVMVRGSEVLQPFTPLYYGSRYFIFHPKLKDNVLLHGYHSGTSFVLERAYHILYNSTTIEIYHKNFFTNQTIQLDPSDIRVLDDLRNLHGRKLRMSLTDGSKGVTTFDEYLGETITRMRNGSFEVVDEIDTKTDYGVVNVGVPLQGTDKLIALGSTFVSVLVPRSKPKPVISVLIDPFDYNSWIALFVLIFVLAIVLSLRDNAYITTLLLADMRNSDLAAGRAYEYNLRIADTTFFKFHLIYYFFNKSLIRELFPFYIHAFYESGIFNQYYKNKSSLALLGDKTDSYPLLTPPDTDIAFILRAFVELQNQWCPPWRYKKIFILNYNTDPLSEDILTAILKNNEPPKILTNDVGGWTYWTFENRRCAVIMVRGDEAILTTSPIYYGSRYFIFHAKLKDNVLMQALDSGRSFLMDKTYHILYNRTTVEIYHKNFFTNQTIQLDPSDIRVPNDLKNLHGRKLRMALMDGGHGITTFDAYLGETIARMRNGSFEALDTIDTEIDYGVLNIGVPFLGTDKMLALGSTFISVLVPRSKPKPVISVLIDPFDYNSWIALFVLIFVLAIVLSLFGKFLSKLSVFEVALEMIMCILGGPSRTYGGWFENQLITNYCLLSIVIVSSYQSLIISYLSFVRYNSDINSADEIRNNCIFPMGSFVNRLNMQQASRNVETKDMCYIFPSRDNAHITTLLLAKMRNTSEAADRAYKDNLRIASTTFFNFHLVYYFYNKSLIRELFPFFVHAFYESGLFNQYYKNKSSFALLYKNDMFVNRAFNVGDLSIIWYLYASGAIVSCLWFMLEVTFFQCQRRVQEFKKR